MDALGDSIIVMTTIVFIVAAIGLLFQIGSDNNAAEKLKRNRAKEKADNKLELFNPKKERSTYIRILDNIVHFKTDIQHIEVSNDGLKVNMSSVVENHPLKFKIVVKPFSFLHLQEDYHNFRLDGILTIGAESETKTALLEVEELKLACQAMYPEPRITYLYTSAYTIDKLSETIEVVGYFQDKNEFKISIDSNNFKLYITAPISSINDKRNFRDFEKFDTT